MGYGETMLPFSIVAAGADMSEKRFRNWLDAGYLPAPADADGKWRLFSFTELFRIAIVARLSAFGVPVETAIGLIPDRVEHALAMLEKKGARRKDALLLLFKSTIFVSRMSHTVGGGWNAWREDADQENGDHTRCDTYLRISLELLIEDCIQRVGRAIDSAERKPKLAEQVIAITEELAQ